MSGERGAAGVLYARRRPCGCLTGESTLDAARTGPYLKDGHAVQTLTRDTLGTIPSRCDACDSRRTEVQADLFGALAAGGRARRPG